jgi:hypothetical protein
MYRTGVKIRLNDFKKMMKVILLPIKVFFKIIKVILMSHNISPQKMDAKAIPHNKYEKA